MKKTLLALLFFVVAIFLLNTTSVAFAQENHEQEIKNSSQISEISTTPSVYSGDAENGINVQTSVHVDGSLYDGDKSKDSVKSDKFDFQFARSVQMSLDATLNEYYAGDTVKFSGDLINTSSFPIVNGNIYARVLRKNENFITEGNYIIDELFLMENINLEGDEIRAVDLEWVIPKCSEDGEYRVEYFFSVGKKFDLGGLSYSEQIIGGTSEFVVRSEYSGSLYFDGRNTVINGRNYRQSQTEFLIDSQEKISVIQPIINSSAKKKTVTITYNLYDWDSLNQKNLKDTKEEVVDIDVGEIKNLNYDIPQMNVAVYYLQIIAKSEDCKSIINLRFTSPQKNIKFDYVASTKFPIKQGEKFSLFSYFHNGLNTNTDGKVLIDMRDENDVEIGRIEYEGVITGEKILQKSDIVANQNYNYLRIIAQAYDEKGVLMDKYDVIYDCKVLGECILNEKQSNNFLPTKGGLSYKILFLASVIVFCTTVIYVILKKEKK